MKGNISIIRKTQFSGDGVIVIEVSDKGSGIGFLDLTMSLEDFAKAITGYGYINCDFELRGLDKVGMIHQFNELFIKVDHSPDDDEIEELVAPYEIDGWSARRDDFRNHHNWRNDKNGRGYKVMLDRWVKGEKDG